MNPEQVSAAACEVARRALAEDLAGYGDVTGRAFGGPARARIVARAPGVFSGTEALTAAAELLDESLELELLCANGDRFAAADALVTLSGRAAGILALERTALNFLARLSGIATLTAAYVAEVAGTGARIAATRKTTPGLRVLEKAAVVHGGGTPHRCGLFDGAMIKDNHVRAAGGVRAAIELVRADLPHTQTLEVEVESLAELAEALEAGVTLILLDNMTPELVHKAATLVAGRALVEVSGGVTLATVADYAHAGADVISVGALTTAAPWIDLSLEME